MRWLLHVFWGISSHRKLPPFARKTFTHWFREHGENSPSRKNKVVLFHDCFMTYNQPEVGISAVRLLEAAGYEVILPEKKCCGRPFLSKGMLEQAQECAKFNVEKLHTFMEEGVPIVGCEPSCMLTFRDEYPDLLQDSRVQAVANNSFLIEEFLCRENAGALKFKHSQKKLLLHGHCHQKALVGMEPTLQMLNLLPDVQIEMVDSGCCGMAGSFGFEKEHYRISMAMGQRRLFETVCDKEDDWEVVAPGISCRQQIQHGTDRKAKHPVEILAEQLQ